MPESWSVRKKKGLDGWPHQNKRGPDIDNLLKGFYDALTTNDADVWDVRATKLWSYEGAIEIRDCTLSLGNYI